MIFNSKELDEKNKKIQMLEEEQVFLQKEIDEMKSAERDWGQEKADLETKINELEKQLHGLTDSLEECRESKDVYERRMGDLLNELEDKRGKLLSLENSFRVLAAENSSLQGKLDYYKKLTPEEYLKIGTEVFTLEQLTSILEKAQSEVFVSAQKAAKKIILQRIVDIIQVVLCPIKTDDDLLKLLLIADAGVESDVDKISGELNNVSLYNILNSESIDRKQCVKQKRMNLL